MLQEDLCFYAFAKELNQIEQIASFAEESNRIEGIENQVRHQIHARALKRFLSVKSITVKHLEKFVNEIELEAPLRTEPDQYVRIGGRRAPEAPESVEMLKELLYKIKRQEIDPWKAHAEYEFIHPFMDGNGRSGRALWLWMMMKLHGEAVAFRYPFLQWYYYQSLANFAERK